MKKAFGITVLVVLGIILVGWITQKTKTPKDATYSEHTSTKTFTSATVSSTLYNQSEYGFSVALPNGWQVYMRNGFRFTGPMNEISGEGPSFSLVVYKDQADKDVIEKINRDNKQICTLSVSEIIPISEMVLKKVVCHPKPGLDYGLAYSFIRKQGLVYVFASLPFFQEDADALIDTFHYFKPMSGI